MKSLQEIQAIRDAMHPELELRNVGSKEAKSKYERQVLICGGTGCTSSGSPEIERVLREEIEKAGLTDKIQVVKTGCFGLCALGPIMIVYPSGAFYSRISADNIPQIVKELLYDETVDGDKIKGLNETSFYKKQHRVALRNCGAINPENIDEYIGKDGYQALSKVL